jgi:hypothetical protein
MLLLLHNMSALLYPYTHLVIFTYDGLEMENIPIRPKAAVRYASICWMPARKNPAHKSISSSTFNLKL